MVIIGVSETGELGYTLAVGLISALASMLLVVIAIGVIKLCEWISHDDKNWLETKIKKTINGCI